MTLTQSIDRSCKIRLPVIIVVLDTVECRHISATDNDIYSPTSDTYHQLS